MLSTFYPVKVTQILLLSRCRCRADFSSFAYFGYIRYALPPRLYVAPNFNLRAQAVIRTMTDNLPIIFSLIFLMPSLFAMAISAQTTAASKPPTKTSDLEFTISAGLLSAQAAGNFRSIGNFALPSRANNFTNGTGTEIRFPSPSIGWRIDSSFTLSTNLQIGRVAAEFQTIGTTTIVNPATGKAVEIVSEYVAQPTYYFASALLAAKYKLHGEIFARLAIGAETPFSTKYRVVETWNFPVNMPRPTPKEASGGIGEIKRILPIAEASIGMELPLPGKSNVQLIPTATMRYRSTITAARWNIFAFGAEIGVQWRPASRIQIIRDTIIERDTVSRLVQGLDSVIVEPLEYVLMDSSLIRTQEAEIYSYRIKQTYRRSIPKPKPMLTADIGIRFIETDGKESLSAKVNVEQTLRRTIVPLLPYIFFDKGSADIAGYYAGADSLYYVGRARGSYAGDASIVPIYRSILAIIARRMKENISAKLIVTGVFTPKLQGDNGDELLARQRMLNVRNILMASGIDSASIILETKAAEPPRNAEQEDESNRVEFWSPQPNILNPEIITDTVAAADPPTLRFYPITASAAGIKSWRIELRQSGHLLREIEGSGEPPERLDWNINDGGNKERLIVAPVSYIFSVIDNEGQIISTPPQVLEFRQRITQREVHFRREEITVMCFNYDETNLAAASAAQIDFIGRFLPEKANFTIIGSTDTLGDEQYNKELSMRRARTVARQLGLSGTGVSIMGAGEDAASFDNKTPEGRFYSRRVRIIVDYE